jgi:hypothetical protein
VHMTGRTGRGRRAGMRRFHIQKPMSTRERPWLDALPLEPRDPDVVRAKALERPSVRGSVPGSRPTVSGVQGII